MNIYSLDGELINSYSYPDGFTISDSGTVELSMPLDEDIDKVMLKIHFTDLDKINTLSNEATINVEN